MKAGGGRGLRKERVREREAPVQEINSSKSLADPLNHACVGQNANSPLRTKESNGSVCSWGTTSLIVYFKTRTTLQRNITESRDSTR